MTQTSPPQQRPAGQVVPSAGAPLPGLLEAFMPRTAESTLTSHATERLVLALCDATSALVNALDDARHRHELLEKGYERVSADVDRLSEETVRQAEQIEYLVRAAAAAKEAVRDE